MVISHELHMKDREKELHQIIKSMMLTACLLSLIGCKPSDHTILRHWENLSVKEKELWCEMEEQKKIINEEWNRVNELLEQNFDPMMTDQERENMIKLRNAPLIRMFQSYQYMEHKVGADVDAAEALDEQISQYISRIQLSLDSVMKAKMAIENQLTDPSRIHLLRQIDDQLAVNCSQSSNKKI